MQKKEKKKIGKEIITTSEVTKSFGKFLMSRVVIRKQCLYEKDTLDCLYMFLYQ